MTLFKGRFSVRFAHVVTGFLAAFLVMSSVAPVAAEESDAKEILSLISSANKSYKAKDYEAALEGYTAAYELYPDSSLLYRLGLTSEKLEQTFDAIAFYEKFIDAVPDDKTAKKVRERLEKLKATAPGRIVVESTPAGAAIFIGSDEGEALASTPDQVEVEPGDVSLYVVLEGYETEVRQIKIDHAEVQTVAIELTEIVVVEEKPVVPEESSSSLATWGWIATGTGVAMLAGGGAFSFLSMQATDDVNDYDKQAAGASPSELQDLKDSADSHYTTSLIFYGVGGALAVTGVTLLIVDGMNTENESAIRFDAAPTKGGAWVGLTGSF